MDKFLAADESDDEQTFHSLGSDEEFFGGAKTLNSDDEASDLEEAPGKKGGKKFNDAFANDASDSEEDEEEEIREKVENIEVKPQREATEEEKNVSELYRKSKLAKHKSKKPTGKTGVVYLSKIPPYMKPTKMRQILSRFGEIDRLFLKKEDQIKHRQRVKNGGNKKTSYEEGWAEFLRKKDAKLCAETMNGKILGGKKGNFYYDDIMNVKYLSGFKWADLTAQISRENETRQSKLQIEIAQATKVNKTFISNIEKSKMLANMRKSHPEREENKQIRRSFEQRAVKTTRAQGQDKYKEKNSKDLDNVLSKVF